jgi:hypothetical protein
MTKPKLADFDAAGDDLESSLNAIKDVADTFAALGDSTPSTVLEYLARRLREHRDEAMDAFRRIYGLDQHRADAAARLAGAEEPQS